MVNADNAADKKGSKHKKETMTDMCVCSSVTQYEFTNQN